MNILAKSSFSLLVLALTFCVGCTDILEVEELRPMISYNAAPTWNSDGTTDIKFVEGCPIPQQVLDILAIQYPNYTARVFQTHVAQDDTSDFLLAVGMFEGDQLMVSIGTLTRLDLNGNNGDDLTSHQSLFVVNDTCGWSVAPQFRAGGIYLGYQLTTDSANQFTASIQNFGSSVENFGLEIDQPLQVNFAKLVNLPPVTLADNEVLVEITCEGEYQLSFISTIDWMQILKERFNIEAVDLGIRRSSIELVARPDLGLFVVEESLNAELTPRLNDENRARTVLGVAGDGSEYGFFQLDIDDNGQEYVLSKVIVSNEGGNPTNLWVTGINGATKRYLVPMKSNIAFGNYTYQMGFKFWYVLIAMLLAAFCTRVEDWWKAHHRRLRPVLATFVLLLLGFGLQAQDPTSAYQVVDEDCPLPENWQELPFMQDIGGCPTCMGEGVWLDNVRRLYCYRVAVVELKVDTTNQSGKIDSLNTVIDSLKNDLMKKGSEGLTFEQLLALAEAMKPNITIQGDSIVNTNTNTNTSPNHDNASKDSKLSPWQLSVMGGYVNAVNNRRIFQPCDCPGVRTGFNDEGSSSGAGFRLTRNPMADTLRALSLPVELAAFWGNLKMPNAAEKGYLPTYSTAALKPTVGLDFGKLSLFGGLGIRGSYFAEAEAAWLTIPAHAGGKFQISETVSVSIETEFPLATRAWVGGNEAANATAWLLRASSQFNVWVLRNANVFIEAGYQGADLGVFEGAAQGGAEFKSITAGFSVPLGQRLAK